MNNFEALSSKKIKLTTTSDNMSFANMTKILYIDSTFLSIKDFEPHCSIPRCINNTGVLISEDGDIAYYAPPRECLEEWNKILDFQLTVNSMVCDRHFRPEDMLYKEILIGGSKEILKTLVYPALPISNNNTQSVSYARKYVPDDTDKCSPSNK